MKPIVLGIGNPIAEMVELLVKVDQFCRVLPGNAHNCRPELILLFESNSGAEALRRMTLTRTSHPKVPMIVFVSESTEGLAIAALRMGMSDYFRPPWDLDAVAVSMKRLLKVGAESQAGGSKLLGESPGISELRSQLDRVGPSDCSVLITGETGTGKELVAQSIHASSSRASKPFIAVNCAALPDTLLESELFGYERGAFTGAFSARDGQIKAADGGTLFLDEIGDMSLYGQAKILRVIETRSVQRLGARTTANVNIRIIAATNQDLDRQIASSQFRKDLFFRLNVARIHLHPLRNRREDVPGLLNHYVAHFNQHSCTKIAGFGAEALAHLEKYAWPGNVRELKNLVEAAMMECQGAWIGVHDLPQHTPSASEPMAHVRSEREMLLAALEETKWNKSRAAERLQWSRMTLYRKLVKYGISPETEGMQAEAAAV